MNLMTKIPFKLIKPKVYSFNRFARGSEVDGVWTKPSPTPVSIEAVIMPYKKKGGIDILPEALRRRKSVRIFSNERLMGHQPQGNYEADEVIYDGESYRVLTVGNWIDSGIFTGYESYAVMIDAKELSSL